MYVSSSRNFELSNLFYCFPHIVVCGHPKSIFVGKALLILKTVHNSLLPCLRALAYIGKAFSCFLFASHAWFFFVPAAFRGWKSEWDCSSNLRCWWLFTCYRCRVVAVCMPVFGKFAPPNHGHVKVGHSYT